jgi:THO complex subunit 4
MVSPSKIIASRPKPTKKSTTRRHPRAEVHGKKEPAVTARARYSTTTPGSGKTSPAPTHAAEKIIVSNLPMDVNEAQIKVCSRLSLTYLSPVLNCRP